MVADDACARIDLLRVLARIQTAEHDVFSLGIVRGAKSAKQMASLAVKDPSDGSAIIDGLSGFCDSANWRQRVGWGEWNDTYQ
jgi:hypothetical protein